MASNCDSDPHLSDAALQTQRLLEIMAQLRDPQSGCPWDIEQDFSSIAPHTLEEAYEVVDAIERGDLQGLKDELGDLLLQVVFHAQMAAELGEFDYAQVSAGLCDKLIRRHPHVFGDRTAASADDVNAIWEQVKHGERGEQPASSSALTGVTLGLPALLRAQKIQRKAAKVGFDWPMPKGGEHPELVWEKVSEEMRELREAEVASREEELGDLLFAAVNLSRHYGIDAEQALRRATEKFERRFRAMEARAAEDREQLSELSLEKQEALWQSIKRS